MSQIIFTERQKFRQWWLWLILLGINASFIIGCFNQIVGGKQFGDAPMSNAGLLMTAILTIILSLLFYCFSLDTQIRNDGIYVRFFPFQRKYKHYHWTEINNTYIRKYNAITEYGGWGLRIGSAASGKAFNVSGNKGLQLEFLNHNKLLIGTKQPEELIKAVKIAKAMPFSEDSFYKLGK